MPPVKEPTPLVSRAKPKAQPKPKEPEAPKEEETKEEDEEQEATIIVIQLNDEDDSPK
jgi:ribosomal protein L12E/L44/L45/RPP1/RPP2